MRLVIVAIVTSLALSACGQGSGEKAEPSTATVAEAPTDPSPRNMGAPRYDRFESVGDGIAAGSVVRDVVFLAGDAAYIEAFVQATDEPLVATLVNSEGHVVAQVAVPMNAEVALNGRATSGQNIVRFSRQVANGEAARFGIRIRKVTQS